ncbi:TolC family protein [Rurimicrobium arvi]|uniref:TolC family protein n=1 Tax=Rurimicrobium arvi TaxID=2049916 RepID=A0ABP8MHF1_9BACT
MRHLSKDEFVSIVKTYHPTVRQAGIGVQKAKADILKTRGVFDPVAEGRLDRKTFDGKLYYSYFNPQITIPTWYGIDIKAGVEEVIGDRVTSEATLGKTSYVGIKFSSNSLLYDGRRAALQQARLFKEQSEAERRLIINDVMYDAFSSYWNWVREYRNYRIISEVIAVNEARLSFTRTEYEQGSRPAIDTTEALAQLQTFYVQQENAKLAYLNAGLSLSNYLWTEDNIPVYWNESIIPDTSELQEWTTPSLNNLLSLATSHPKIDALSSKISILEVDKKLKQQYFIPKLSLSANMLNKGYTTDFTPTQTFLENNHKIGATLNIPLFYRDAIGGYRMAKLKIAETELEQSNQLLQIENKVRSYYNEVLALQRQIDIYTEVYRNNQKLFHGEQFRFRNGESSLFILNSRENKMLETSLKLLELKMKLQKSYVGLLWAAGQLG